MTELPDIFLRNVRPLSGGPQWLHSLPALVTECEDLFSIRVVRPFDLSYNYVALSARQSGEEVVLKIGIPNLELKAEIRALQFYAGVGSPRLLECDEDRGFLLMEYITPGRTLSSVTSDDTATRIAAETMRKLWRGLPKAHAFPTTERWFEGFRRLRQRFDGGTGPFRE